MPHYDSFHWKCSIPEIHQIEKLGFLGMSRYKFKEKCGIMTVVSCATYDHPSSHIRDVAEDPDLGTNSDRGQQGFEVWINVIHFIHIIHHACLFEYE